MQGKSGTSEHKDGVVVEWLCYGREHVMGVKGVQEPSSWFAAMGMRVAGLPFTARRMRSGVVWALGWLAAWGLVEFSPRVVLSAH
jgi:hypothetical protein